MTRKDLNSIKEYLNGNLSNSEGVALLTKYCTKRVLVANVIKRPTALMIERMKRELSKIHSQHEQTFKIQKTEPSLQTRDDELSPSNSSSKHPNQSQHSKTEVVFLDSSDNHGDQHHSPLQSIEKLRAELYRKRGHLHGRLHEATTKNKRFLLARELHGVQKQIIQVNRDFKAAQEGNIPVKYLVKTEAESAALRLRTVKIYIARYQKQMDEATTIKAKEKAEKYLNKYLNELKQINEGRSENIGNG